MRFPLSIILFILIFSSCGGPDSGDSHSSNDDRYGGVMRVNEVSEVRSLHPLEITEATGFRIASQLYEGLVKFDQSTLEPKPALAESWEVNEDATQWTFYLRRGVMFHDDACFPDGKGRELKASDVKNCFEMLCWPDPSNQMFWIAADRIVGAKDYREALINNEKEATLPGVTVIDDYTVQIDLTYPSAGFLNVLGHNAFYIYPKEAVREYGAAMSRRAVGTGPFTLQEFKYDELVVLARNENYWGKDEQGRSLPYLDAVQVSFLKDKTSELLSFKKGELDLVFTLPIEYYSDIMGDLADADKEEKRSFHPQVKPSLSVHYYAFQHDSTVFSDVRVRKAFNMAIDKEALVEYTLQGEGSSGVFGVVPPAFKRYPHKALEGYSFNPEEARKLLEEAGFPNGDGFPILSLDITSGGTNYEKIAQVVQRMLKDHLNVNVTLKVLSMSEHYDNAERGASTFWRDGWIADYPDPENFLCLFVGDGMEKVSQERLYLNSVRYNNPKYDSLYFRAIRELDETRRFFMYRQLDQMLLDDAVIMPLYYEEITRLIPNYVMDFPQNPIEYRDYSTVWFDKSLMSSRAAL